VSLSEGARRGSTTSSSLVSGSYGGRRERHGGVQHDLGHVDCATGHAAAGQGPLTKLRGLVSLSLSFSL
jgi:hypothetical protein